MLTADADGGDEPANPYNPLDACGDGRVDVLADGLVNKVYNLWDRNPMTVSASYLKSGGRRDRPPEPTRSSCQSRESDSAGETLIRCSERVDRQASSVADDDAAAGHGGVGPADGGSKVVGLLAIDAAVGDPVDG